MIEHKLLDLFGGRMDAWGQDWWDHDTQKMSGRAVRGPVTHDLIKDHLEGRQGVGIYPMWEQDGMWRVKWGCCDIDTGVWMEAYGLAKTLQAMGFTPFIERSRSKGWHIWIFCQKPVLAEDMRRALKVAYKTINLQAREANPKAGTLRSGQLGNYVRLPYKGALVEPSDRQTMMYGWNGEDDGSPLSVTDFLYDISDDMRARPDLVVHWASKWHEPERKRILNTDVSDEDIKRMFEYMRADLVEFIMNGPGGTGDRSEALVALAHKLKRAGYEPKETLAAVTMADQRWGKYHMRPDGEEYLLDIVERTL